MVTQLQGFRLSPQQRSLWRLQQQGGSYNAAAAFHLRGVLDEPALMDAVSRVIDRHEILRTSFHRMPGMKTPFQVINLSLDPAWSRQDLSHLASDEREDYLEVFFGNESRAVFDLERGPVLRL